MELAENVCEIGYSSFYLCLMNEEFSNLSYCIGSFRVRANKVLAVKASRTLLHNNYVLFREILFF